MRLGWTTADLLVAAAAPCLVALACNLLLWLLGRLPRTGTVLRPTGLPRSRKRPLPRHPRRTIMDRTYRIGQIVPSSNTTMETEIPAMLRAREAIRFPNASPSIPAACACTR